MTLIINRAVLTVVILASISGSLAQESYLFTDEPIIAASVCYPFTCKTSKQSFTSETCIFYDVAATTFYAESGACGTGKTCTQGAVDSANWTCIANQPAGGQALIGEYCASSTTALALLSPLMLQHVPKRYVFQLIKLHALLMQHETIIDAQQDNIAVSLQLEA
ncbi:unnamed protein product [Blepharisma stoltei]|uniref:Secreted protein n=1 Tax=Blepharisma stoltei TaxID=1481888 RepID=A0AAU9JWV8_9CILI|nr:unnamed protein product [Blepharisma stoltei]